MRGIQPHNVKNVVVSTINRMKIGFCRQIFAKKFEMMWKLDRKHWNHPNYALKISLNCFVLACVHSDTHSLDEPFSQHSLGLFIYIGMVLLYLRLICVSSWYIQRVLVHLFLWYRCEGNNCVVYICTIYKLTKMLWVTGALKPPMALS